jgi:predicted NAD/FAD-binding protein
MFSNYPNMMRWFDKLGVPNQDTDVSLSLSLRGGQTVEWNSAGLSGLFAKRAQLASSKFHNMIRDMVRFQKGAPALLLLTVSRTEPTTHYLCHLFTGPSSRIPILWSLKTEVSTGEEGKIHN